MNLVCEQELQRSTPYEKYIQYQKRKSEFNKGWLKSDPFKTVTKDAVLKSFYATSLFTKLHNKKQTCEILVFSYREVDSSRNIILFPD